MFEKYWVAILSVDQHGKKVLVSKTKTKAEVVEAGFEPLQGDFKRKIWFVGDKNSEKEYKRQGWF